jgi:hypothetical protein
LTSSNSIGNSPVNADYPLAKQRAQLVEGEGAGVRRAAQHLHAAEGGGLGRVLVEGTRIIERTAATVVSESLGSAVRVPPAVAAVRASAVRGGRGSGEELLDVGALHLDFDDGIVAKDVEADGPAGRCSQRRL